MSTKKRSSTRRKKPPLHDVKAVEMKRFLIRFPYDLADWIDAQAHGLCISRDTFMRQVMTATRLGFKAAETDGTDESLLFRKVEERLLVSMERAVEQAIRDVLAGTMIGKNTGPTVGDRKP
jgi:hypothetical protein